MHTLLRALTRSNLLLFNIQKLSYTTRYLFFCHKQTAIQWTLSNEAIVNRLLKIILRFFEIWTNRPIKH